MADDHQTFLHSYILLLLGIIAIQNVGWEMIDGLLRAFAFHPLSPFGTANPLRVGVAMFFVVAGILAIVIGAFGCAKSAYEIIEPRFRTGR